MMNCVAPDEIREGDLMAFIEGDASARVKDHVARCPACTAEARAMARASRSLLANLYRASCPATETLAQYQTNLLRAGEKRRVAEHLKTCPRCMAELRRIAGADLPAAGVWRQPFDVARAIIEAVLIPPRPELVMTARGGGLYQRLYQADDLEIIVGIEPVTLPGHWRVRGRVMRQGQVASEAVTRPVYLTQPDRVMLPPPSPSSERRERGSAKRGAKRKSIFTQVISSDAVDELGYFVFDGVAPGKYDLWLERPDAEVVVRDLEVGANAT